MKLTEKIKTYGLLLLMAFGGKNANAQAVDSTTTTSAQTHLNIPKVTALAAHCVQQKFADVPQVADKDTAIAVPIINIAQYLKDGSVEIKLAHPHDICAPNIDDAMRYVECLHSKLPFNFEEYYKCLSEEEQERFNQFSPFEKTKYRLDCEKYYNDPNNFHSFTAYHNDVRRYLKVKGADGSWIKRVHRIGPNQADKTAFALEMAFMACHPDSVVRHFAAHFVDANDENNRAILIEVQQLLYDKTGEMRTGEGAWKKRTEAAQKLLKVKVGNFCVDVRGNILSPKGVAAIRASKGYRFFSQHSLDLWQKMDNEHCYKLRQAINDYVNTIYMAANSRCPLDKVPYDKQLESGTLAAYSEGFNHFGPFAASVNISESKFMWQKMNKVDYITFDFLGHMRQCLPENGRILDLAEKSWKQLEFIAPYKAEKMQRKTASKVKEKNRVLTSKLQNVPNEYSSKVYE